ncbi:O-acetylhomoserine aminocarboxypropyltransferase/cysteine synthase family protein [Poseidonibacter ostreae]|jgi:O-acetylhomoserine (thiol)-lyase|uniref:Aminotransferase class V-fold PLP-dependent enzyme n=1 Tax=Poseidonibacter ostreae TaxID=2654171 RepID=A0A6L4WUN5_9BACT|nr:O-acetylhomoserine aminocarboxypropyltransferase/cysteine synthase family protein [Poseidonibacter ostreae]KAB7884207.1 aminotransferase class V-fold PLP-dependent enzyme [Poseidonibacter ostreae]KAB7889982.1 aminotransferase class V-fold PLP-dependent enzyme [Poseidonibacter ostreae]KAB7891496.1 aminotransferase class V-fold PLP-dependent enzyme [Poseidonibacter ostreae]MAC83084.1 O-acetylhomoserine aminocarboxypropyltransferase [Arcobacter sp.]
MQNETIAVHGGYNKKEGYGSMSVPIAQTTAYAFRDSEHAANLFALKELGPIYTRLNNPTTDVLEQRFAQLEGGAAALCVSSGQSAIFYAIANVAKAGDNILISDKLYGGAVTLLTHTIKRFGIEAKIFRSEDASNLEEQIDEGTRAIFFESLSNPQIAIADVEKIVEVGKRNGVLTICDNTVATAALFNPIKWGVDVVVHSTSKYTNGQGTVIGGIIVERDGLSEFFKANENRYSDFTTPDASYHGLVYTDVPLPNFCLRARLSLARDIGAVQTPLNSWLLIQTLETLALRVDKHSDNALEIAEFLEAHPKVKAVNYPGLKSDKYYDKAQKYFKGGKASGLISFDVESFEEAKKVIDSAKLFSVVVNIGDSKSLITHPASTTHSQMSPEELEASGINPVTVRLSIGLENTEDLKADLSQALN